MIGVLAYLVLVVAIPALLCGHQGQPLPWPRRRRRPRHTPDPMTGRAPAPNRS